MTEGTTEVTYVYRELKGDVVVHYQDEAGNTIKETVVDTPEASTGTGYDTTDNKPTRIVTEDGRTYELVPDKTAGEETGKVIEGTTEVTYVYRELKEEKPVVPTTPTPPVTSTITVKATPPAKQTPSKDHGKSKSELPKTGDTMSISTVLGGMVLSLGALLALFKKKHD